MAKKREYNKNHDEQVNEALEAKGWRVIRIWECELKKKNIELLLEKIAPILEQGK